MFCSSNLFLTQGFTPFSTNRTFFSKVDNIFIISFHIACNITTKPARDDLEVEGCGAAVDGKLKS